MRKGIHVFLTPFRVKPGRRMHFGFLRGKGAKGGVGGQCVFICFGFSVFYTAVRSVRLTLPKLMNLKFEWLVLFLIHIKIIA